MADRGKGIPMLVLHLNLTRKDSLVFTDKETGTETRVMIEKTDRGLNRVKVVIDAPKRIQVERSKDRPQTAPADPDTGAIV